MNVRDCMTPHPITIEPSTSLAEAVEIMRKHKIRRLPVLSMGHLVGIVTDRDLRGASSSMVGGITMWEYACLLARTTVQDLMRKPVTTIGPDAPLEQAALAMYRQKIGGLPVLEDGNTVGIVTESDILRCFTLLLGADRGFLQITVVADERARSKLAPLLSMPQLRTITIDPRRHEAVLVFCAPCGFADARALLDEVRLQHHVDVLRWHLSEPTEHSRSGMCFPVVGNDARSERGAMPSSLPRLV